VGREPFRLPAVTIGASLADVFGTGCAGSNGVPRIGFTGVPEIGRTFTVTLRNGPPLTWCPLFVNGARQDIGLPGGCTVYPLQVALDFWRQTGVSGAAAFAFPLPVNNALVGIELYGQWVTFDPNGSYLNALAFSDGLHAVIGRP
jgi:hypothetical protein